MSVTKERKVKAEPTVDIALPVRAPKTLEQIQAELMPLIKQGWNIILAVGRILHEAEDDLNVSQYDKLKKWLIKLGWTLQMQEIALLLAKGELDAKFARITNKTVLVRIGLLDDYDRRRLLSNEEFAIKVDHNRSIAKQFFDMEEHEQARILGERRILPFAEQKLIGDSNTTVIQFKRAKNLGTALAFTNNTKRGEMDRGLFWATMGEEGAADLITSGFLALSPELREQKLAELQELL